MTRETYQHRENRDKRARELKAQGHEVIKSSSTNQLLHPQYIQDYHRKLTPEECGFGNTIYKTYFPHLYHVEVVY